MTETTTPNSDEPLEELRRAHDSLVAAVADTIELPQVDLELDVESRDSIRRKAKHVHQMCVGHSETLATSTKYKLPYLTSMYLAAAESENPFALTSATRVIVELSAFTYEVGRRLRKAANKPGDWQSRGQAYFGTIVQARYGSGAVRAIAGGVGESVVLPKPIHVMDGLRSLSKVEGFESTLDDYSRLSDFVHHNASSHASTAEGYYVGTSSHSGAGRFETASSGPWLHFKYPVEKPAQEVLEWTAPLALKHARAIVRWHNDLPRSPYSEEELEQLTGSRLGFEVSLPDRTQRPIRVDKTGRNDPCPCGSGRKYKRCHGA